MIAAAWTTNSHPYYTHDGDWVLWIAGAMLVLSWAWCKWKERGKPPVKRETEPYHYGFWDDPPESDALRLDNDTPDLYDWESEGVFVFPPR